MSWDGPKDFYNSLSLKSKSHLRRYVLRNQAKFKTEIIHQTNSQSEIDYWYNLYLNVQNKGLELNTFPLPLKLFKEMNLNPNWEVVKLSLAIPSYSKERPCCVVFCYKTQETYIPVIIGLDYTYNKQFGIYRQALYQLALRAHQLKKKKILLGFSANIEKKKFGAKTITTFAYMHISDSYNMEALSTLPTFAKQLV